MTARFGVSIHMAFSAKGWEILPSEGGLPDGLFHQQAGILTIKRLAFGHHHGPIDHIVVHRSVKRGDAGAAVGEHCRDGVFGAAPLEIMAAGEKGDDEVGGKHGGFYYASYSCADNAPAPVPVPTDTPA